MSLEDRRLPRGSEGGHQRRALIAFVALALGIIPQSGELTDAAQRRNPGKKKKGKRKNKKNRNDGECQVQHTEQQILNFIAQAAKKYGQSKSVMERVARCESTLNPCALNRSGPYYGLFQYLKSTWKTTPYSDRSIWDPEAQALATGWMWQQGRKNEWACQ